MHVVYDVCCGKQETNKSRFYIGQPSCCVCVCVMGAGVDASCLCSQCVAWKGGCARFCPMLLLASEKAGVSLATLAEAIKCTTPS